MSNLIYLICAGIEEGKTSNEYHRDMCKLCIYTLREYGDYEGDILVATDIPEEFNRNNVMIEELLSTDITSINDIGRYKLELHSMIDIGKYDNALYLDNDIICTGSVKEIFDMVNEGVAISEEYALNSINWRSPIVEDDEKEKAKMHPRVNTGTMCFNSGDYQDIAIDIRIFMEECLELYDYDGVEQLPVNVMILRDELSHTPIPHEWVKFPLASRNLGVPLTISDETKLLHYAGTVDTDYKGKNTARNQLEHMELTVKELESSSLNKTEERYTP